jgi:DHA1 family inner membrane transport protein
VSAGRAPLLALLAAANFAAGLIAFVVIGLIEPLARDLALSRPVAGWVLSVYAIAYAVGSPLLVALTGAWPRRAVLMLGMGLLTGSALTSALAPSYEVLLLSRVVSAFGAGLITPVTSGVAVAVAAPGAQGRALSTVFFGLTLAQALGIPVGGYIAFTFGWRAAFWLVFVVGALLFAGLWWRVPRALSVRVNSLATLGAALSSWRRMLAILFTGSFLGAIYVLYTYFSPLLVERMGFGRDGVSLTLFVFGLGAIAGNIVGGRLTDRFGSYWTLVILCLMQAAMLPFYVLLPLPAWLVLVWTFVWSAGGWAFAVPQQARIVKHAPEGQSVALALNAAAIYVGVAGGAAVAGAVLTVVDLAALGAVASVAMLAALAHLIVSERAMARSGI